MFQEMKEIIAPTIITILSTNNRRRGATRTFGLREPCSSQYIFGCGLLLVPPECLPSSIYLFIHLSIHPSIHSKLFSGKFSIFCVAVGSLLLTINTNTNHIHCNPCHVRGDSLFIHAFCVILSFICFIMYLFIVCLKCSSVDYYTGLVGFATTCCIAMDFVGSIFLSSKYSFRFCKHTHP